MPTESAIVEAIKTIKQTQETVKHLQKVVQARNEVIKILSEFYFATNNALAREKIGHNDGWQKVQDIADKIEDNYNLEEF